LKKRLLPEKNQEKREAEEKRKHEKKITIQLKKKTKKRIFQIKQSF
jgi:hypothetical protein